MRVRLEVLAMESAGDWRRRSWAGVEWEWRKWRWRWRWRWQRRRWTLCDGANGGWGRVAGYEWWRTTNWREAQRHCSTAGVLVCLLCSVSVAGTDNTVESYINISLSQPGWVGPWFDPYLKNPLNPLSITAALFSEPFASFWVSWLKTTCFPLPSGQGSLKS